LRFERLHGSVNVAILRTHSANVFSTAVKNDTVEARRATLKAMSIFALLTRGLKALADKKARD